MRMSLEQTLRQELRLTPQLIMQMKLLQVSALDLEQLVRKELEENPALEQSDDAPDVPESEETAATLDLNPPAEAAAQPEIGKEQAEEATTIEMRPGEEYSIGDLMPDDVSGPPVHIPGPEESEVSGVELAAGPGESLHEALIPRLRGTLSNDDARIAEFIVDSLNDDGFLTMTVDELAASLGVEPERVNSVLYVIQRLEPGGIGCRDVRESFLVQLELAGFDPHCLERTLVSEHWDLLMKKQTAKVAKLCGTGEDEVREAIRRILCLEPRPARRFAGLAPNYVAPDFSVEWQGDQLAAVPNDGSFPRLRLSRRYSEILRDPKAFSKEQVAFARGKLQRAMMFLKGIESRRHTLQKLVELVIDEQREFFLHGRQHLKPATLREAAGRLGVHPSTVSRAIAGKYVETTYGIFPMSYFFKAGANDTSRESIQQKIKVMIDAEDKHSPLSDDEIGRRLSAEGIRISRRTVAKYRDELGIAGSNERKGF